MLLTITAVSEPGRSRAAVGLVLARKQRFRPKARFQ
jgi:hypothetical protein